MAVIAGIGTREYYRVSGYRLQETYMVKDLTISGLHAGRADLLAVQPTKIKVEHQDMPQAASALFLPLPPKAPQLKRKQTRGNKKAAKGREGGVHQGAEAEAEAAASRLTEEKAKPFQTEHIERVEEIDVRGLLSRLESGEIPPRDAEQAKPFVDTDTFSEWYRQWPSSHPSSPLLNRSPFPPLPCWLQSWFRDDTGGLFASQRTLLAGIAATTVVGAFCLWLCRRQPS